MFSVIFFYLFNTIVSSTFFIICILLISPFVNEKYTPTWRKYTWVLLGIIMLFPVNPSSIIRSYIPTVNINCFISEKNLIYPLICAIWLIGSFIYLRIQILQFKHFENQLLEYSEVIDMPNILSLFNRIKVKYKIRKKISLYSCEKVNTPMVLGIFQTVMLLPNYQYSEETLEGIFEHEFSHIRHLDEWYKIFILATKSIYWFNPLVYVMAKYSYQDLELLCDRSVTQNMSQEQKISYSQALLESMKQKKIKDIPISSYFYGSKNMLNKRITSIFNTRNQKNGYAFVFIFLCFFLLFHNFITFGAVKEIDMSTNESIPSDIYKALYASQDIASTLNNAASEDENDEVKPDEEILLSLQNKLFANLSEDDINYVKEQIRNIHWKFEGIILYDSVHYKDINGESWGMLDDDSDIYKEKTSKGIDCYSCNFYTDILNHTKEIVNNDIYSNNIDLATSTLKDAVTNRDFKMLITFHRIMHDLDYWLINYPVSNFSMGPPNWHGIYVYYNVLKYN